MCDMSFSAGRDRRWWAACGTLCAEWESQGLQCTQVFVMAKKEKKCITYTFKILVFYKNIINIEILKPKN
jgi:hypothetical protein